MEPRSFLWKLLSGVFQASTPSIWKSGSSLLCVQFFAVGKSLNASRDVVITRFLAGFKAWRSSLRLESIVLHHHDSTVAQKGQTKHSWLLRGPLCFEQPCRGGHTRGATTSLDATKCFRRYKEKKCFVFWLNLTFIELCHEVSALFSFSDTVYGRFFSV